MSEGEGKEIRGEQGPDDDYWAALFQTEESVAEPLPHEAPDFPLPQDGFKLPAGFLTDNGREPALTPPAKPAATPPVSDLWQLAQQLMDADETIELQVTGFNKGGLLVDWNGLQGFVPASQIIDFPHFHVERERPQTLAKWLGKTLRLKLTEVTKASNRLILSERAALVPARKKGELLRNVQVGEEREGAVTNLTHFGAFIDLGGVEGLVHISEISWSRVSHPSALLHQGQVVRCLVLSVDHGAERVALSIKRLRPDPWQTAEKRYKPGSLVRGTISNITTYGAFVLLEEELEGLVHISELAEGVFKHPHDVVDLGERVTARILTIDARQKRIALSLRGTNSGAAPGK